ncbi:MAG: hypothetical protein HOV94_34530 [Saccharothrix sp.]|nr:hypothetical protein [Saccharothrix sp.]
MISTKRNTGRRMTDAGGGVWVWMNEDLLALNGSRNMAAWRTYGEVVEMVGELREVTA